MATTVPLSFDIYARDHASTTFSRFSRSVSTSNRSVGLLRGGIGRLAGAFAGLGIIYKTTQFLKDSVDQAREANKVSAQTTAVLKSTKGAANLSAEAVGDLANKISLKAGIDDEAIQSGENLLLTFRNIRDEVGKGNDIFTRATQAAVDMSVAMGTDLKSANIQLGKALNDPVKGITALTRVGVSFTEGQQEQIKALVESGDRMAAQKIILRELNKEFAGSAKAQADPADRARVAWENFQETVGQKLLPVLDRLLIWFVNDALPAIQQFSGWLSEKLGPVISNVAGWFSDSSAKGGQLSTAFQSLVTAGRSLYESLKPIAIDIAMAIKRNWPEIRATISSVVQQIASTLQAFADFVKAFWDRFGKAIMLFVGTAFKNILTTIRGALKVIQGILDVFTGVLTGDWSRAWKGVKEIVSGLLGTVVSVIRNDLSAAGKLVGGFVEKVVGWFKSLPHKVVYALAGLAKAMYLAGLHAIEGLLNGLKAKAEEVGSFMKDLAEASIVGPLETILQLGSPSKVMHGIGVNAMEGLINGITSKIQSLKSTMQSVAQAVSGLFGNPLSGENVNTTVDIFREQGSQLSSATRLRNDIRKLIHKGLSRDEIQQLVETQNFAALHDLASSNRARVQRYERGQNRLDRVIGQSSGLLNEQRRARLERLKDDRDRDQFLLKGLRQAIHDGFDGAEIILTDRHGHGRVVMHKARNGGN